MAQEPSNALRYRQLLEKVTEGICLWYPSETAAIGSVGYLRDGYFVTLFNAFNPPDGLPSLTEVTGPPDLEIATPPNTQLAWMSLAQSGCSLRAGIPVDTTLVNIGFTVHSQTADAAFLVPGGKHRRVKTLFSDRQLKRYLADNYNAISERYSSHQKLRTLMILRGTTHSNGYCRGLLHQSHRAAAGTLTLNPLGLEMFSLEMGGNRSVIDQWLIQAIPATAQLDSNPTYMHCIIVKPVLLRKRDQLLQKLSSTFSVFTQDPVHSTSTPDSPPNASSQQAVAGSSTIASAAPSTIADTVDMLDECGHDDDDLDEDGDDADELSLFERSDPPDNFEALLDAALAVHPDVDEIIADWDVLYPFLERRVNDLSREYEELSFDIEFLESSSDGRVAELRGISTARQLRAAVYSDDTKLPALPAPVPSDNVKPKQDDAQQNRSPRCRPALLSPPPSLRTNGSSSSRLPAPTASSIGPYVPMMVQKKSPCPALNALCNHGAYGMPRDGQHVNASVLANALVQVYGLKPYFASLLAYSTFIGITKGKFFTLDLDELCAIPFAHSAALAQVKPTQQGQQTDGRPSRFLINQMLESAQTNDPRTLDHGEFDLDNFALWRNKREQETANMPRMHMYIAAGKIALLLQVFGQRRDNYKISRTVLYDLLAHERLPDEWQPNRFRPSQRIGLASTIHVSHHVRRSMAKLRCHPYIPYYVWGMVILSAITGIMFIMRHSALELPSVSLSEI